MATTFTSNHEHDFRKDQETKEVESDVQSTNDNNLFIPIRGTKQYVTINTETLVGPQTILGVLQAEIAPLSVWLNFSVEYFRQKRYADFELFMEGATSEELAQHYSDDLPGRLDLLNAYASYFIFMYQKIHQENRDKLWKAKEYEKKASRLIKLVIDLDEELKCDKIWVTKGCLELASSTNLDLALGSFDKALLINSDNMLAYLGITRIYFKKQNYRKALEECKKVVETFPGCPVEARVALGLCFYRLNNLKRAQQCFVRAISINGNDPAALAAFGVLHLSIAARYYYFSESDRKYFGSKNDLFETGLLALERSHKLSSTQPLVLNHLANHLFLKENREIARVASLARKAFKLAGKSDLGAIAMYILGRNYQFEASELLKKIDIDQEVREILTENVLGKNEHQIQKTNLLSPKDLSYVRKKSVELFQKARECYAESCKMNPTFFLAKFGLAQMELQEYIFLKPTKDKSRRDAQKGKLQNISSLLEKILIKYPVDRDALYLHGHIKIQLGEKEQGVACWSTASEYYPDDVELLISLAREHQMKSSRSSFYQLKHKSIKKSLEKALFCSEKAKQLILKANGNLPFELINNLAVLTYFLGDYKSSERYLKQILQTSLKLGSGSKTQYVEEKIGDKFKLSRSKVIPYYNLARVKETTGKVSEARVIYNELIKQFPSFAEARLCLGQIHFNIGQYKAAANDFSAVTKKHPSMVVPLLLLYKYYYLKKDSENLRRVFLGIIKLSSSLAYARLWSANVKLQDAQLRKFVSKEKNAQQKINSDLTNALGIFSVVLQSIDKGNIFAATGFGCVIAISENIDLAKEVLDKVKDYSASIDNERTRMYLNKHLYKNLGNLEIRLGNYDKAINCYENCLKRFIVPQDYIYHTLQKTHSSCYAIDIHGCLAHAYFLAQKPESSRRELQRLLIKDPTNLIAWYNLASAYYFEASLFLKLKEAKRTLTAFKVARQQLEIAQDIFLWVAAVKTKKVQKQESAKENISENDLFVEEPETPPGSPLQGATLPSPELITLATSNKSLLLSQNLTFLKKAGMLKEEVALPSVSESNVAVDLEEGTDRRRLGLRAPETLFYSKVSSASVRLNYCKMMFVLIKKYEKKFVATQEEAQKKQQQVLEKISEDEQKLLHQKEQAILAELREQDTLQKRLKEQEEANTLLAKRMNEKAEEQRTKESLKQSRKRQKREMDTFIVDQNKQEARQATSHTNDTSSSSDSSDAEDYNVEKRKRSKLVRKKSVDSVESTNKEVNLHPVLAEEEENELGLDENAQKRQKIE